MSIPHSMGAIKEISFRYDGISAAVVKNSNTWQDTCDLFLGQGYYKAPALPGDVYCYALNTCMLFKVREYTDCEDRNSQLGAMIKIAVSIEKNDTACYTS